MADAVAGATHVAVVCAWSMQPCRHPRHPPMYTAKPCTQGHEHMQLDTYALAHCHATLLDARTVALLTLDRTSRTCPCKALAA